VLYHVADPNKTADSAVAGSSDLPQAPLKFGKRPLKSSSLRRSINVNDEEEDGSAPTTSAGASTAEDDGPVVVRPALGRSGSTKLKKRASSSRLSFGGGENLADDGEPDAFTPKKSSLGQRAVENSAFKKSISQRLPTRTLDGDDDRPRYSREYLQELQSSTPNTPQNLSTLKINDDEMDLDASELEGAMVVEASDLVAATGGAAPAQVLTEAEIAQRKERRARLALEKEYISLDGGSDDEANGSYISLLPRKKEKETRLVAEDEDLGEGYDEFVEDGRLSLGKKAEREARRRRKQEMAELINAAEEDEDEGSDDSEAERRAAYEEAQTRAGMDGLHRTEGGGGGHGDATGLIMVPKMKPLPDLADCLARMQSLVQGVADEVARKRKKIADLEREKAEILSREQEVQEILDKAGQKYQAVMGGADSARLQTGSPHRPMPPGLASEFPAERGLESLGTTPIRRQDAEEVL